MRIKLFSSDGKYLSESVEPDLRPIPDVIVWNQRVFAAPHVTDKVREKERLSGTISYIEAYTYFVRVDLAKKDRIRMNAQGEMSTHD